METAQPLVGIVVVGYNMLEMVRNCLSTLRTLDYPHTLVIYVDNLSQDGTLEAIVKEFPEVDSITSGANRGYCGGNNVGVRRALERGAEYVLLLNADTVVHNVAFLTKLVEFMEQNPRFGKCGPRVFFRNLNRVQNTMIKWPLLSRRVFNQFRPKPRNRRATDCSTHTDPQQSESLNGVCVLIRRQTLEEVGLLDEALWGYVDEIEWDWRAELSGWHRVFIPVESVVHLQPETGYETDSQASFLQKRNGAYWYRKTGRPLSFIGWSGITIVFAMVRVLTARFYGRSFSGHVRFLVQLVKAYVAILFRRYEWKLFGLGSEWADQDHGVFRFTTNDLKPGGLEARNRPEERLPTSKIVCKSHSSDT